MEEIVWVPVKHSKISFLPACIRPNQERIFTRDKTLNNKLIHISNDVKQNYIVYWLKIVDTTR